MTNTLLLDAERQKLADTLNCATDALPDLSAASLDGLRAYRHAANDALFARHRRAFARIAAANKLVPVALSAKITERAIGPFLAGRVASEMEPDLAVVLSKRLPKPFLAECCRAMDPARATHIVRAMPIDLVIAVSAELEQRAAYIVMAQFVEALEDDALHAVMKTISDAALLRCGLYVESAERLEQIVWGMDDQRLKAVIATASRQSLDDALELMIERGSQQLQTRLRGLQSQA